MYFHFLFTNLHYHLGNFCIYLKIVFEFRRNSFFGIINCTSSILTFNNRTSFLPLPYRYHPRWKWTTYFYYYSAVAWPVQMPILSLASKGNCTTMLQIEDFMSMPWILDTSLEVMTSLTLRLSSAIRITTSAVLKILKSSSFSVPRRFIQVLWLLIS